MRSACVLVLFAAVSLVVVVVPAVAKSKPREFEGRALLPARRLEALGAGGSDAV
jgi:hypothetical protein